MITRTLSKALLLLTISLVVPAVARPALAGVVHSAQGRRHRHKHHERRHERQRQREHEARGENHGNHDGERHGEL